MKIFKVFVSEETQSNWAGNWYDEYFGHIVVAENEDEAMEIAFQKGLMVPKKLATVEEINLSEKGIVLSDFNAG
ncbi:hypothetical protein SAMN04487821_13421 [Enterococcus malodoratus]|uniref:hypothetical protein n=1 Tax=Enterococcus malodoratus TaxID=71451 RepID=UPI0008B44B92|nr:hypothetical protein [Enterococcus malodoratus]SET95781.1 hypothetical protein SAMN04487821_13421 [Enterococcus malodoratus]